MEFKAQPPPAALLFSSLLSLLPPVSSCRRERRDKSPPLSRLSNQQKFAPLSLPQLLQPASSKQSTSAAGEESNNISGQLTPTSIHCPSPLIEVSECLGTTEEVQHLKKLIQDYIASFIKVGDMVGASKFLKFKYNCFQ
ncbi:hypothetical protein H5410_064436 [Solanum commersonii]|uniref:Uncharacterized protein n=1 Tax=Solanum commersonii TaxID=4109 RepID=A0A9J5W038_SOLCO|nr:hypothetical protein H5410_064436 [Solanum commersonii]